MIKPIKDVVIEVKAAGAVGKDLGYYEQAR